MCFFNEDYVLGYKIHHTYVDASLSAAYVCGYYPKNHWVKLHLWGIHFKGGLCLWPLLRESLGYTKLMGAEPWMQSMIVSSTYKVTELHYTFAYATLSTAYIWNPSLQY